MILIITEDKPLACGNKLGLLHQMFTKAIFIYHNFLYDVEVLIIQKKWN